MENEIIERNKEDFKEWMGTQVKSNGRNYILGTINSYCNSLNKCPGKLVGVESRYKVSLFSYEDVELYNSIVEVLMSASNFDKVNDSSGHRTFSNSIKKYEEFLNEKKDFANGKWFPDENVYSPKLSKEGWLNLVKDSI